MRTAPMAPRPHPFKRPAIDRLPIELLAHIFVLATHGLSSVAAAKLDDIDPPACGVHRPHSVIQQGAMCNHMAGPDNNEPETPAHNGLTFGDPGAPAREVYPPLDVSPQSATCPLALSAVNRGWRRLALAEAYLWTTVVATAEDVLDGKPDLRGIHMFVARSRRVPINILLDMRDPHWDFRDPCPSDFLHTTHVRAALALLLPHLHRWRSFALLSDTFTPMHAALSLLSFLPCSPTLSPAPFLESFILMRCNEYACHTADFHPAHLKDPTFAPLGYTTPLPRLRNLQLLGTHVDWAVLPALLPAPTPGTHGLEALELSYNHQSVCPAPTELRALLCACPGLRTLTLKLSFPDCELDADLAAPPARVELLRLDELVLMYGDAMDTAAFLQSLHAPDITRLELEDGGHPADMADEDASALLHAIAGTPHTDGSNGRRSAHFPPTSTRDARRHLPQPMFPGVRSATLRGVTAGTGAFAALFHALPYLRALEIDEAIPGALAALLPASGPPAQPPPCARLSCLRVRGIPDALVAAYDLAGARAAAGAPIADVRVLADGAPSSAGSSPPPDDGADADALAAVLGEDFAASDEEDGWEDEPLTPDLNDAPLALLVPSGPGGGGFGGWAPELGLGQAGRWSPWVKEAV